MNQKKETQKIKVNNGQELIAKAREYKNSGGEWKLRERYIEMPTGKGKKGGQKEFLEWGIIIGNDKQTIDIRSAGNNVCSKSGPNDEIDVRDELEKFFPEARGGLFVDGHNDKDGTRNSKYPQMILDCNTFKTIKEEGGEYHLVRYLQVENSWHLKQILHQWIRENETKIYQSANPHFSDWVEIVDGQDGNMYLYVGEKNSGGGREIKIGITKSEFEKGKFGDYDTKKMLEMSWDLFTITRPRTPAETHEYYSKNGGLEKEWQGNSPHFGKLCRKYLEELRERLNQRLEYWKKQPSTIDEGMCMETTTIVYIDAIDHELEVMKNNRPEYYAACDKDCTVCGVKLCCHFEGKTCSGDKNWARADENLLHFYGGMPELEINKNNQITQTDKTQLLQYFLTYHITKITLDNGKLVVEYDNSQKGQKVDNLELEKYKSLIQNLPNHEISLSDLQKDKQDKGNPTKNPKDNKLILGLALGAGAVALIGVVVYFWNRKGKR